MREEGRISSYQAMNFIIAIILPTAILVLPSLTAERAAENAWLSPVIAFVLGLGIAYVAASLALRFPDKTVIQFAPSLLGPVLGKIVGLVFIGYFFFITIVVQREFAELMTNLFYDRTPNIVFVGLLTGLAVYVVYKGLEVLARVNDIIILLFLFSILFFLVVVIKDLRPQAFLPFLGEGIGPVVFSAIPPAAWFAEAVVIMMLVPFLQDKGKAIKANIAAVTIVFLSLMIITVGTIGILGSSETATFHFASFAVVRRIEFAGLEFFQRQDALFMALWVGAMLMKLGAFFYVGVLALSQWFNLRSYRPIIVPLATFFTVLSVQSWDSFSEFALFTGQTVPLVIGSVAYGVTLFLFVVAML
ncbi:MAG: endospore germination permease, partial [Eubacteriales bacterium]|nr:endospore germination permease [Eubacteriales bacterium]